MAQNEATPPYAQEKELAYRLLGVLITYAPDGPSQEKLSKMYADLERHAETPRQMVLTLANCISDGLQHGNWPWTEPPMSEQLERQRQDEVEAKLDPLFLTQDNDR